MGKDKKTKYNNKKIEIDGYKFDSRDESLFYLHLKGLKEQGIVVNFYLQPKFELIPKFEYQGKKRQAMTYSPDFKVSYASGDIMYYDVKSLGTTTQQGELRRKLFEYFYPQKNLVWICRNLKHGDKHGWIIYEDLKKIYRDKKKEDKKDV